MWEEFLPNSIKNTNVKWYLFKHDENTKNIHYLVPLSVKFYQIFIFTYDFDTDLFFSTSCSQLISGESLVSLIHSTHIHIRAFALIPPKKTWNCNFFLDLFFSTFFFKSQHYTEKNQNKCLTLQLDSCKFLTLQLDSCNFLHYSLIAVIILKIFWSEQVHLRTSFFTADSRREVVVQM